MKYTKKQLSAIAYLTSIGDKARLAAYKQQLENRVKAKKEARERRKADIVKIAATVKIGDVFLCSWGYEQTNVDFFQVIAKAGKNSVRIRQVYPTLIADEDSGSMAANREYQIPANGELLPAADRSVFIEDQDNGDLKRVDGYIDKNGDICAAIKLRSYAYAYRQAPGVVRCYESWYA